VDIDMALVAIRRVVLGSVFLLRLFLMYCIFLDCSIWLNSNRASGSIQLDTSAALSRFKTSSMSKRSSISDTTPWSSPAQKQHSGWPKRPGGGAGGEEIKGRRRELNPYAGFGESCVVVVVVVVVV